MQELAIRLIDVLAARSAVKQTHPAYEFVGIRGRESTSFWRSLIICLVLPFGDLPVVRKLFWQHAMPLFPSWFEEYERHEVTPLKHNASIVPFVDLLGEWATTHLHINFGN